MTLTEEKHTAGNVPKLRFPEFLDVPEWDVKCLIDVCEKITQGGTPDTSNQDYWNGTVEWLTPAEMGKIENRYVFSSVRKITETGLKNCSSDLLPINSIIISTRAPIGYLAINKSEMAINQGCKGLVLKKSTNADFLYYSLGFFKNALSNFGAGNTFKELSSSSLKNFSVSIPKLPEQQKIADCLSSIDERITAEAQKLATLKTHKKGLMQQLFPAEGETLPKLRFPEFRDAGGWNESLLLKCFPQIRNGFVGTATPYYSPNGIPYLQGKNIKQAQIDTIDITRITIEFHRKQTKSQLRTNDILMVQSGHVGECAVVDQRFSGGNCHALIIMTPAKDINSKFFIYYFYSNHGKSTISKVKTGNTIQHILASDLQCMKVIVPSHDEQQKIADCLSSLDELIAAQTQKLATLKTHKKGLMQQLFPNIPTESTP